MKVRICAALALIVGLSSCMNVDKEIETDWAWLTEGADQKIIVKTEPALADCTLFRNGIPIAHINPTPGAAYIRKTKWPINVTCTKPGYQTVTLNNDSDTNGATVIRAVLTGASQWLDESIYGIDNKYDSPVTVTLPKEELPQ